MPFLAHATMEPLNCTVHVKPDSAKSGSARRSLTRVQSKAAKAAGLPVEKVTVHNHLLGGGFGRRLEPDMVVSGGAHRQAGRRSGQGRLDARRRHPARHLSPGLSRHDRGERCRTARSSAGNTGSPARRSWRAGCRRRSRRASTSTPSIARSTCPTTFPNFHVEYVRAEPPAVPTGFWRGVGPNNNVFAIESFMDELAHKAGKDPVEFRRAMLDKNAAPAGGAQSRGREIRLGRAAAGARRPRHLRAAVVRELHRDRRRSRGRRERRGSSCAASPAVVDTGIAVNPDTIVAQLEGGLIFGLTAALYGEITIDKGRVQQSQLPRLPHAAHRRDAEDRGASSSRAARRPAASARPARRRLRRRCATRSTPRPASRCAACRSIASSWPRGKRHEPARVVSCCSRRRRSSSSAVGARRLDHPRPRSAGLRRRHQGGAGRLPGANPTGVPADAREGEPRRARRISGAAADCMVCHTAQGGKPLPAASASSCRSARSIRPTSRRTRKPASAITATRIS